MNYIFRLFVLCLFFLPDSGDAQTNTNHSSFEFAIYCLKDTLITAAQAAKLPLDGLELASYPLLTARDIKKYHWSTHQFDLQTRTDSVLNKIALARYKSAGMPFVVIAGKIRIYLGTFWWWYSSAMPPVAYIDLPRVTPRISLRPSGRQPDLRNDQRIHDALLSAGVLVD